MALILKLLKNDFGGRYMKKNIDFYIGKAKAINISKELNKFGLEVNIISRNSYKFEELQEILSYSSLLKEL